MKPLSCYFEDFLSLFFPDLCAGCGTALVKNERVICTTCIYQMPVTNFHKDPENRLAKQLWGRILFKQASSFVYFRKGGSIQNIMHQLKYNKRHEAGYRIGQMYAEELKKAGTWQIPDIIIPVPLHPAKFKKRGYNQSECIANGMASILNIPVAPKILTRIANTQTQTKKSRFERYENLNDAFLCLNHVLVQGKHILLVDDVSTTGATLEACGIVLSKIRDVEISIATIAFTE